MDQVTVALDDETLASLDRIAANEHGGDRDDAAAALVDEWLERRHRS